LEAAVSALALPSHWKVIEAATSEDWLRARAGYLTASDVSAVLGLNPYKSRASVVRKKQGQDDDRSSRFGGSAMMGGQYLESGVFEWFLHDRAVEAVALGEEPPVGCIVRNPLGVSVLVEHPRSELMLAASPDGLMVRGDGERQLVEVKVLGPEGSYLKWDLPCKSEAWKAMKRHANHGCPVQHWVQLQTQLMCTGEGFGWVVGNCGTKRLDHPFPRDEDIIRRIEDATAEFWKDVQRG
jgi:hypothetical protein